MTAWKLAFFAPPEPEVLPALPPLAGVARPAEGAAGFASFTATFDDGDAVVAGVAAGAVAGSVAGSAALPAALPVPLPGRADAGGRSGRFIPLFSFSLSWAIRS